MKTAEQSNTPSRPGNYTIELAAEDFLELEQSGDPVAKKLLNTIVGIRMGTGNITSHLRVKYPGWTEEDFSRLIDAIINMRNRLEENL